MHPQTIWAHRHPQKRSLLQRLHNTHIHSGLALGIVALLSLTALTFTSFFMTEVNVTNDTLTFSIAQKKLHAANQTFALKDYKGVDVMKYTKDLMRNQQTDAEIESIVSAIVNNIHPTHIAISIPLDSSEAYPDNKPAPRTAKAFTQKWADAIHSKGVKIIWRGTWSGIEGIYDFPKLDGADRFPAGTAATAIVDGNNSWLGKTYKYIIDNPTFFADGDVWGPLPERTEGIFQDSSSFLTNSGAGIQTNYVSFFNDLKSISDIAFTTIGKTVKTGWTANNFTEVKSTWLYNSLFSTAGIIAIDHYGSTHTVQEMESDLRFIYTQRNKQIFLQEWGDYWNQNLALTDRLVYIQSMYNMLQKLANEGILAGFNYWGGWTGSSEGILVKENGIYKINERGALLASFFANNPSASTPVVSPTPVPTPVSVNQTPTPTPTPNPTPTATNPSTSDKSSGGGGGSSTRPNSDEIAASSNAQTNTTLPYKNGDLINDKGTIYLIMGKYRLPFTNFDAFVGLGFANRIITTGDSSLYQTPATYRIEKSNQQHPWGSWVIYNGTVYYSHESGLLGVPSYEILVNNGGSFSMIMPANSSDRVAIRNDILKLNDPRVIR